MSLSELAIAIGGKPDNIKQFAETVEKANIPDLLFILDDFKILQLEKHLAVYALYLNPINWYESPDFTWQKIRNLATDAKLSYVFYRLGEDYNDVEIKSNFINEKKIDLAMLSLFGISRSITFRHQNLKLLK